MDNKKFVGFLIIGAKNREEAVKGKGLILWLQHKPGFFTRMFDKFLLSIYWVEKEDYEQALVEDAKNVNVSGAESVSDDIKVEMPKRKVYKKKSNGSISTGEDTKPSTRSSRK